MNMISTYFSIILIYLLIGLIVYILPTFLVSRSLMRKGYIGWGFLAGLLTLIIFFLLSNYFLNFGNYQAFSKYGPCGTCYEWGFIPFLMLWTGSMIGAGLFIIHNLIAGVRYYKRTSTPLMKWPKAFGYSLFAGFLTVGIMLASDQFRFAGARSQLVDHLPQATTRITGESQLTEIGQIPIARPLALPISPFSYVEEKGLHISSDGGWLFLKLPYALEIWDARTFKKHYSFDNLEYSDGPFAISPDSKFIALKTEQALSLYEITTMKMVWQNPSVRGRTWEMRFLGNGEQLIFFLGKTLVRVDTKTGNVFEEMEIPFFKDRYNFVLNQDGNYFIGYHEGDIYLFDGITGEQLHSENKCVEGLLTFLPNNDILCWRYQSGVDFMHVWDISGNLKKETEYPVSYWPGPIAYSSDTQMVILSDDWSGTHLLALFQNVSQEILLESAVTAATFSPDNRLLVIATADGYLRFFAQTSAEN